MVEVQNEMKSKGVNIVGVVTDPVDDNGENKEAIEKSKLIHEKTKASYPFLMPDEMKSKGVNIVGVVTDPVDDNGENKEAIEKSKLIHEKTKASYPFLMPDGMATLFFDKNYKVL